MPNLKNQNILLTGSLIHCPTTMGCMPPRMDYRNILDLEKLRLSISQLVIIKQESIGAPYTAVLAPCAFRPAAMRQSVCASGGKQSCSISRNQQQALR